MLVPLPEPPTPGLSLPDGDMASDPVLPFDGKPIFGPGSLEITAPAELPLPPLFAGGAADPTSIGAPNPEPFLPAPEPTGLDPPPKEGGGGTT
jgi:hypothetical protein